MHERLSNVEQLTPCQEFNEDFVALFEAGAIRRHVDQAVGIRQAALHVRALTGHGPNDGMSLLRLQYAAKKLPPPGFVPNIRHQFREQSLPIDIGHSDHLQNRGLDQEMK